MSNRPEKKFPRFGEVYYMRFEGEGSEQRGWRPGMVYSNNVGNKFSPNIIALPFITAVKKMHQPTHVLLPREVLGADRDSVVLCENPVCISKEKIGDYLGEVTDPYLALVAVAFTLASSCLSCLSEEELVAAWRASSRLNSGRPA